MDQVIYLASGRIQQNKKDRAKLEAQFYEEHAWQRMRGLKNMIIRVYCNLASFIDGNNKSGFSPQKCPNEM